MNLKTNLLKRYIQDKENTDTKQDGKNNTKEKHDSSGNCQRLVHVPAHMRDGKWVEAYNRICGQKHTAKEAAEKNQEERIQENVSQSSWEHPITTKENQYLLFDGKKLTLYENGSLGKSWNAVSGKSGFQHPNYQDLKKLWPNSGRKLCS